MDLIVAADRNWAIGKGGDLIYSIPEDMKYFRRMTTGKTVVMGRKTLESFPGGKPLPKRVNIVLSRGQVRDDCIIVRSYDDLKTEMKNRENEDVFVIGGGEIYRELLPYCHEALVTKVDAVGNADTFFPNLDEDKNFVCVYESEPIDDNGNTIRFTTYQNTNVKSF